MSVLQDAINNKATEHESHGGECKTILIGKQEVHVCLDENGIIIDETFRQLAKITGQS